MYCNRCGTPLRAGDRFCPRCGAAVDPNRAIRPAQPPFAPPGKSAATPSFPPSFEEPPRRKSHTAGIILGMLGMVLLLLAAAVWSQRDALDNLFDPAPPTHNVRPEEDSAEKVGADRPDTDAAGSLFIELNEDAPEQDMARALLADAGRFALEALYGDEPLSRAGAREMFCNLSAGGYESALEKAMEVNSTTIGTLSRWDGYSVGQPLMEGNCGYLLATLYAAEGDTLPLDFETETVCIGLLWSGSSWKVDASGGTVGRWQSWPRILEEERSSSGFRRAAEDDRAALAFGDEMRLTRPVIPGSYDAMPTEVYGRMDGSVVLEFWAFNGTDTPLDAGALDEVSLYEPDSGLVFFELHDFPIEPLHLAPGEGQLVTLTIPSDQVRYDPLMAQDVTCAVWFYY